MVNRELYFRSLVERRLVSVAGGTPGIAERVEDKRARPISDRGGLAGRQLAALPHVLYEERLGAAAARSARQSIAAAHPARLRVVGSQRR